MLLSLYRGAEIMLRRMEFNRSTCEQVMSYINYKCKSKFCSEDQSGVRAKNDLRTSRGVI